MDRSFNFQSKSCLDRMIHPPRRIEESISYPPRLDDGSIGEFKGERWYTFGASQRKIEQHSNGGIGGIISFIKNLFSFLRPNFLRPKNELYLVFGRKKIATGVTKAELKDAKELTKVSKKIATDHGQEFFNSLFHATKLGGRGEAKTVLEGLTSAADRQEYYNLFLLKTFDKKLFRALLLNPKENLKYVKELNAGDLTEKDAYQAILDSGVAARALGIKFEDPGDRKLVDTLLGISELFGGGGYYQFFKSKDIYFMKGELSPEEMHVLAREIVDCKDNEVLTKVTMVRFNRLKGILSDKGCAEAVEVQKNKYYERWGYSVMDVLTGDSMQKNVRQENVRESHISSFLKRLNSLVRLMDTIKDPNLVRIVARFEGDDMLWKVSEIIKHSDQNPYLVLLPMVQYPHIDLDREGLGKLSGDQLKDICEKLVDARRPQPQAQRATSVNIKVHNPDYLKVQKTILEEAKTKRIADLKAVLSDKGLTQEALGKIAKLDSSLTNILLEIESLVALADTGDVDPQLMRTLAMADFDIKQIDRQVLSGRKAGDPYTLIVEAFFEQRFGIKAKAIEPFLKKHEGKMDDLAWQLVNIRGKDANVVDIVRAIGFEAKEIEEIAKIEVPNMRAFAIKLLTLEASERMAFIQQLSDNLKNGEFDKAVDRFENGNYSIENQAEADLNNLRLLKDAYDFGFLDYIKREIEPLFKLNLALKRLEQLEQKGKYRVNLSKLANDPDIEKWNVLKTRRFIWEWGWSNLHTELDSLFDLIFPEDSPGMTSSARADKKRNVHRFLGSAESVRDAKESWKGELSIRLRLASLVDFMTGLNIQGIRDSAEKEKAIEKVQGLLNIFDFKDRSTESATVRLSEAEFYVKMNVCEKQFIPNVLVNRFKRNAIEAKLVDSTYLYKINTHLYYLFLFDKAFELGGGNLRLFDSQEQSAQFHEAKQRSYKMPLDYAVNKVFEAFTEADLVRYVASVSEFRTLYETEVNAGLLEKKESMMREGTYTEEQKETIQRAAFEVKAKEILIESGFLLANT